MRERLKDSEIRAATHRRLLRYAWSAPGTVVIDELGLDHGACRVDIAVINGHIRGLEIKAEADVLDRLPGQIDAYGAVVDRATLIAAPRHVERALVLLPEWWGVMSADQCANGAVQFRAIRGERVNRAVDPLMVARLLWHPEASSILRSLGRAEKLLRQPREALYRELVVALPRQTLTMEVRRCLKARANWRDRPLPS